MNLERKSGKKGRKKACYQQIAVNKQRMKKGMKNENDFLEANNSNNDPIKTGQNE
jgi:hypothetical protein